MKSKTNLILVAGLPGSGKTTIGREISKILKATYLDKDTVSNGFTEYLLSMAYRSPNDRESNYYVNNVRSIEYWTLINIAFDNLECGVDVVCSAPFIKELKSDGWLDGLRDRAEMMNVNLSIIWINSPEEQVKERLSARNYPRDIWKLKNWNEYVESLPNVESEIYFDKLYQNERKTDAESKAVSSLINELLNSAMDKH